jgi:hypothetical protein
MKILLLADRGATRPLKDIFDDEHPNLFITLGDMYMEDLKILKDYSIPSI